MKKIFKLIGIALRGQEKDFTSGKIERSIFLLAIPMILEMVMEALFAIVDVFFVSKVSIHAVATVGLTESVITIVYSIAIGLSMAATAMVARRIGEGDHEAASVAAVQSIAIALGFSLIISVLGFIYAPDILKLMGGTDELVEEGVWYTRILFGTNFVIMLLFLLNAIFRGAGDAAVAMRSLWIANILNILLDPCLIFGWGPFPELGLAGAAVATSIGRGVGVLYQLAILIRGRTIIRIAARHLRLVWSIIKRLLKVSIGGMGQYFIASSSWIFIMRIISEFGEEAVAGYTISIRLIIFAILPAWGMANAAATLVGQNLGAGKPERAEKCVWKTSFYTMVFLALVSLIYLAMAHEIAALFHNDESVLHYATKSLQIISLGYVAFAYGMVLGQAFNGAGDTRTPTIINFLCFWVLQIPLAYAFGIAMGWEAPGVFWAIAISESVLAIVCILVFRRGAWKNVEI